MRWLIIIYIFLESTLFGSVNAQVGKTDTCLSGKEIALVSFSSKSVFLNEKAKSLIDSSVLIIKKFPSCKIAVTGFDASCEECAQISWGRAFSTVKYLRQKGIDSSRIIFYYGYDGEEATKVSIRFAFADEEESSWLFAPHPCFSYHHLTKRRCKNLHK